MNVTCKKVFSVFAAMMLTAAAFMSTAYAVTLSDGDSIQSAIDSATGPEEIELQTGSYDGFVVNKDGITVTAASGATPVIDGIHQCQFDNYHASIIIGGSNVTIEGLSVVNGFDIGVIIVGGRRGYDPATGEFLNGETTVYDPSGSPKTITGSIEDIQIRKCTISGFEEYSADDTGYGIFVYGSNIVQKADDGTEVRLPHGDTSDIVIGCNAVTDSPAACISSSNTITENHRGIGVLGDVPKLKIHYNKLFDNDDHTVGGSIEYYGHGFGHYYPGGAAVEVDIRKNWWGDSSGPSGGARDSRLAIAASGTGDEIYSWDPSYEGNEKLWFFPYALDETFTAFASLDDDADGEPDDYDNDGIPDGEDNCPGDSNSDQSDADSDGRGDACDECPNDPANDTDDDGICGDKDTCPYDPQNDTDTDAICADVDNCPSVSNPNQADADKDLIGDVCDGCPNDSQNDIDGDGVCGDADNCPYNANPDQADSDGDGIGDACESPTTTIPGGGGGGGGGGTTVPVLSVSGRLSFAAEDTQKSFTIQNSGGGTLEWSIGAAVYSSGGSGWISGVSPLSGTGDGAVFVTVDRMTLAPGTYTASLPVSSNGGSENVAVEMQIEAAAPVPALLLDPASLSFSEGDSTKAVSLSNYGDAGGSWSTDITYDSGAGWLSISPSAFSLEAQETFSIDVVVDTAGLEPGTHTAVALFTEAGGADEASLSVSVQVDNDADNDTDDTQDDTGCTGTERLSINRSFCFLRLRPPVITNSGSGSCEWTAAPQAEWLQASPEGGTLAEGESLEIDLQADTDGLSIGFHSADLRITYCDQAVTTRVILLVLPFGLFDR